MSRKQRPYNLTNLKAKAAERHIYFDGFERYNLMSLCGFGLAERLHQSGMAIVLKSAQKNNFLKAYVSASICKVIFTYFGFNFALNKFVTGLDFIHFRRPLCYFLKDLGDLDD